MKHLLNKQADGRRLMGLGAVAALSMSLSTGTGAQAGTVYVPATGDIFLATQPVGTSIMGYFGADAAPANSPVALGVMAGATLTFSASGSASVDDSCFAGPDGGCYADESGFSPAPASGTYKGPAVALIGVFEGPGVTAVDSGPASLDYTQAANTALASQSPALNQIFFIGDGLTGTGSGSIQDFVAPTGATSVYIAVADSYGSSTGNAGGFDVSFTGATAVPEPASWALMILGLGMSGAMARRARRGRTTPTPA
jgi:hypothetical protein